MELYIDLNADMGEYLDDLGAEREASIFPFISSCNIACGGHTGDVVTMRDTLLQAQRHSVVCGAHPSYPDREGFGRRTITIDKNALSTSLMTQVQDLLSISDDCRVQVHHLKPHGALYNDAAADYSLSRVVTQVAKSFGLMLVGPPGSGLETTALQMNVPFVAEGFVDRQYQMNGALLPRSQKGAIHTADKDRIEQALILAKGDALRINGQSLSLTIDTLCIHSDSPGAQVTARNIYDAFAKRGIVLRYYGEENQT